jgi:hypothetical protein
MPPFTTVRDCPLLRMVQHVVQQPSTSNSTASRLRSWPLARRLRGVRDQEGRCVPSCLLIAKLLANRSAVARPQDDAHVLFRRLPMDAPHGAPCPDAEAVIASLNVTTRKRCFICFQTDGDRPDWPSGLPGCVAYTPATSGEIINVWNPTRPPYSA